MVVVYGRRRIGKTETIRHFITTHNLKALEVAGVSGAIKKVQIKSFLRKIKLFANSNLIDNIKIDDWNDIFYSLEIVINNLNIEEKKLIFIDEFPWFDTQKSGFLEAFCEFWNSFCTKRDDIIVIVCGSAASYMINKIIRNKKTLHGRVTHKINMEQFKLKDTKELLLSKGCNWSNKAIVDTYIAFGGIAKYLKDSDCSLTPQDNINHLCFDRDGLLVDEYEDLFESLFHRATMHRRLMDILSKKWSGYTQVQLAKMLKCTSSSIAIPLKELEVSGFLISVEKLGQTRRDKIFRNVDCFSYFYHKWMKNNLNNNWLNTANTQAFKIWSGIAFENICHIHIKEIKNKLGISGVDTSTHYWNYKCNKEENENGAQIDMIIEHKNGSNNLDIIECKYHKEKYTITDSYYNDLRQKISIFDRQTKNKYNIRVIFISSYGVEENTYYNDIVNLQLTLNDLF